MVLNEIKQKLIKDIKYRLKKTTNFEASRYWQLYKDTLKEYKLLYSLLDARYLNPGDGELRKYQLKTFEFCSKILNILEQENIPYFLEGGTIIGAIRHNGFVPWDDDFDVGLMRNEYNRMIEYCQKNFVVLDSSKIYLSRKNRSEVWQQYLNKYPNQIIFSLTPYHIQLFSGTCLNDCVNIDIFSHDYFADNYTMEEHKKYLLQIKQRIAKLDNYAKINEFLSEEMERNINIVEHSSNIYYGLDSLGSYVVNHKRWFETEKVFPLKVVKFENKDVCIQNDPADYIAHQYADYMSMPYEIEIAEHYQKRTQDENCSSNLLINFLEKFLKKQIQKTVTNNIQKNILFRNLRVKLINFDKKFKYRNLYKKISYKYEFLKSITDICHLKPIEGPLRQYQLDITKFTKEFLQEFERLGIRYFLTSGTLLGAYRHRGFIPWDDDIDIGMLRDDFNRLQNYLKSKYKKIPTDEIYYSKKNKHTFIKKYLQENPNIISYVVYPTHLQVISGTNLNDMLSFEVFPFDYYNESCNINELKEYIANIREKKIKIDNFDKISSYFETEIRENPNIVQESNKIYCGIDNYVFDTVPCRFWLEKEDIFPLKKLDFEGEYMFVPNNVEKFLKLFFGDNYMSLPEKLILAQHVEYRNRIAK